jgi:hypothetical protein
LEIPANTFQSTVLVWLYRFVIAFLIALVAFACSDRSQTLPTVPSTTESVPPPPNPRLPGTTRIIGQVLDTWGEQVSGVALTFHTFRGPVTATSDAAGSFDVTVDPFVGGLGVGLEKPGYERAWRFVAVRTGAEVVQNLRLHPPLRVAAGDSLPLSIRPDDPTCGFDDEFLCRTVRIAAATAGRLTVEIVPDRAEPKLALARSGDLFPRPIASRLSLEVTPNSETPVDVVLWWDTAVPVPFTLKTSVD